MKLFKDTYPWGWFHLAFTTEVIVGRIHEVHAFGKDILFWRDTQGQLTAHDAHCPHFGAHLNRSLYPERIVVTDRITCPFHGWEFDVQGNVVNIEYSDVECSKLKGLDTYTTQEFDGLIFIWYPGEENQQPDPVYTLESHLKTDQLAHVGVYENDCKSFFSHDNFFDTAHFGPVHGIQMVKDDVRFDHQEHHVESWFENDAYQTHTKLIGPSYLMVDATHMGGSYYLITSYPETKDRLKVYVIWPERPDLNPKHYAAIQDVMDTVFREDMVILKNRKIIEPQFVRGDGALNKYYRWVVKFYETGN